ADLGVVGTEQGRDQLTVRERPTEPPGVESSRASVLDREHSFEVIEELLWDPVCHPTCRVGHLRCRLGCSGSGKGKPERGGTSQEQTRDGTPVPGLRSAVFVTVHGCPPTSSALAWAHGGANSTGGPRILDNAGHDANPRALLVERPC